MVSYYKKKIKEIFNSINFKKQYIKKLKKNISNLKIINKKFYQGLNFLLITNTLQQNQKINFLISYIICFYFSPSNSIMQLSDAVGNSKIFCSAGSVDLTGKQKISRRLALIRFLKILSLLKSKILTNKPIALHLKNIGYNKYFLIKKLKNKFFLKAIKTFDLNPYNGCRKKKEKRKR